VSPVLPVTATKPAGRVCSCLRIASLLAAALLLQACASPAYYPQALSGHFQLMSDRQDVTQYLQAASADDPLARQAALALEVLAFAGHELQLPANGAYRQITITGRNAVVWNVVATDEFGLEPRRWCFPVAGCVPYLGYYQQAAADKKAAKLAARGLDSAVSGAIAYSTLGWFDDPLLDTLLRQSPPAMAATLIHELAHQKLYVPGDTTFNESFASFVEREGLRRWLAERGEAEQWVQWQQSEAAYGQFLDLLRETRNALSALYASDLPDAELRVAKQEQFRQLDSRYRSLVKHEWAGRPYFSSWFEPAPNNADLALLGQYSDGLCAFSALLREAGGDLGLFYQRAAALAQADSLTRRNFLQQPC
jgi:predicted aminopeptidase